MEKLINGVNVTQVVSQVLQNEQSNQKLSFQLVKAFPDFCDVSPAKLHEVENFGEQLHGAIALNYVNSVNTTITGRYIKLDGNWIKVDDKKFMDSKGDKKDISLGYILNANIQKIRLGETDKKGKMVQMPDPELAKLIKDKKDAIAKYYYKMVKRLQDLAKLGDPAIHEVEGTKKARSANKETMEFLADLFDKAEKSIRVKEKNGMVYSDGKLFAVMAKEFLVNYKKNAKQ